MKWTKNVVPLVASFLVVAFFFPAFQTADALHWRQLKKRWPRLWFMKRPCRVYKVIDGDTVHVFCRGRKEKLRLVGIDTPETKHPFKPIEFFGPEASARAKELIKPNSLVWLAYEKRRRRSRGGPRGHYGRLLVYLFLPDGTFFNLKMIREGYAFALRRYPHTYMKLFTRMEAQARRRRRGMWAFPDKVRATIANDHRYRKRKWRCIQKTHARRFSWVIGDSQKRYYFTRRHPSYFRTNPYTRVLFCSVQEARRAGYIEAPRSYFYRATSSGYSGKNLTNTGENDSLADAGSFVSSPRRRGRVIVIADKKRRTFRVFPKRRFRVFFSVRAAKEAGFAPSHWQRRWHRRRHRRSFEGGIRTFKRAVHVCGTDVIIVGNRRSKVYRLPSQRSYKRAMKSRHVIFFCTEKQAINAGFRKAKR